MFMRCLMGYVQRTLNSMLNPNPGLLSGHREQRKVKSELSHVVVQAIYGYHDLVSFYTEEFRDQLLTDIIRSCKHNEEADLITINNRRCICLKKLLAELCYRLLSQLC